MENRKYLNAAYSKLNTYCILFFDIIGFQLCLTVYNNNFLISTTITIFKNALLAAFRNVCSQHNKFSLQEGVLVKFFSKNFKDWQFKLGCHHLKFHQEVSSHHLQYLSLMILSWLLKIWMTVTQYLHLHACNYNNSFKTK